MSGGTALTGHRRQDHPATGDAVRFTGTPALVVETQSNRADDLVVMAPADDVVPEKGVGTTAAGNLSVRKMTKTDRTALHTTAVVGHLLLAVRESFAAAPGLASTRVVVVRPTSAGVECLVAGVWARVAVSRVVWSTAGASLDVARQTAHTFTVELRGEELRPLDQSASPTVAALMAQLR